jgi:hypothetical protein
MTAEDLIDFIALTKDLTDEEIKEAATDFAPGNPAVLSILTQIRSAPFLTDEVLDYFTKRLREEVGANK